MDTLSGDGARDVTARVHCLVVRLAVRELLTVSRTDPELLFYSRRIQKRLTVVANLYKQLVRPSCGATTTLDCGWSLGCRPIDSILVTTQSSTEVSFWSLSLVSPTHNTYKPQLIKHPLLLSTTPITDVLMIYKQPL